MKRASKKSIPLISCSLDGPHYLFTCEDCGERVIASADDSHCPFCYASLPSEREEVSSEMAASLGQEEDVVELRCDTCDKTMFVKNTKKSVEELCNSLFCVSCGSAEVTLPEDDSEDDFEDDVKDDKESEGKCKSTADDGEVNDDSENSDSEDKNDDKQVEDEKKDREKVVTEEVQDKLGSAAVDDFEPVRSSTSIIFLSKEGNPAFRICKSKINASAHALFDTNKFIEIFQNHAKETGLSQAIKEFNGEIYDSAKVISSLDLEALAFEQLRSSVMPKFIDCIALAIEGGTKGIYGDVHTSLKASFYDEMLARGVAENQIIPTIEAAFASAGPDVFSNIIAKAQELFNKSEESFKEIKSTIQAASNVSIKANADIDLEQQEIRSKLNEGNVSISLREPVSTMAKESAFASANVEDLRSRMSLRRR